MSERPRAGERAPDFTLPGPDGPISLRDLLARGPVALYFYPRDDTSGCTVEACAFRDAHAQFTRMGAQIVGVSRDDVASHARFRADQRLPFLLLSDVDGEVHARYGVHSRLGGLVRDRVTFVIDREGVVREVYDSKVRFAAHAERALAAIEKFAFAAEK